MQKHEAEILRELISFGLSRKEAVVYLTLLESGRSTVSQIARKASINRTTAYSILDSLVIKKLARISGKEPKQEYVAERPENLVKDLNKKMRALNDRLQETREAVKSVDGLIPRLKSIQKVEDRPQVRFYEGRDGLKEVYEDTLTSKETIRAYATIEDMHATLGNYFPAYYKRRARKGIFIRGIIPRTSLSIERTKYNEEEARESALVPSDKFGFHPEINVYDNKVMIASWREKLGIIIESAEIADAMKKIFELAWAEAKRLDANAMQTEHGQAPA